MYGMVNDAVRLLVTDKFGEQAWESIRHRASAPEAFAHLETYDDAMTYALVAACAEELNVPAEAVLNTFGRYWVEKIAAVHYSELLNRTGTDFVAFVKNLDHMHARIRTTFRDYEPPSFRVLIVEPGRLQVDYYSRREGLLAFVVGLFEGLGEFFEFDVRVEHLPDDSHPMPCKRMYIDYTQAQR